MNLSDYQFFSELMSLPYVEEVWLYGSRARGDHQSLSDIDLAILCPRASSDDWQDIVSIIEKADTLFKIDCIRFDQLEEDDPFKANILKHKKLLYKKQGGFVDKELFKDSFQTLGKALGRFKEAVKRCDQVEDDLFKDATIQRFEFTIELFWKSLKKFLAFEQIEAKSPREVMQKSFQIGLITQEKLWLQMLEDRNWTSHTYKEEEARRVYERVRTYLPHLEQTFQSLQEKYFKG